MKKYNSFINLLYAFFAALLVVGCVHDDKYDEPNLANYECQDLTANMTIAQVKALHGSTTYIFPSVDPNDPTSEKILEGYVSSSDETGNIYKTIYIQDSPTNPTHGFTISIDAVSTYTTFPQGKKIYIKLNDLAIGTYGGLVQLGIKDGAATGADAVSRIPESMVSKHIIRSCSEKVEMVPKVLKISEFAANQNLLGALIQVDNVEFTKLALCNTYAPDGTSVDRQIGAEGYNASTGNYTRTAVVRNSGFASFANQILPSGNGKFVGIFSKFNSTYQMYINRLADIDMEGDKDGDGVDEHFPRLDGITSNPCSLDPSSLTVKTVADVKALYNGSLTQITGDFLLKAKVTANDETGNLYKYVYVEDATGGIRVNINKLNLYLDSRFKVGKEVYIKLNNLLLNNVSGELQIGGDTNPSLTVVTFGQVPEGDVYKHFFDSNMPATAVVPTERTITQLTAGDVGRWIKIKNVEFIDADLGKPYAGTAATNRTLKDCNGNTIILRTSNFATFAGSEVDGGKGDVYAILSIFNGTYQLWIPKQIHADFDNARCDGTIPPATIFTETFSGSLTDNWTAENVTGTQVWNIQNFGNPAPCAVMNGYQGGNNVNEDWLVSKPINLNGLSSASMSFDSDGRYNGNALEVYVTENYTGSAATTTWVQLTPTLDTNLNAFNSWTNSGNLSLNAFVNKSIRIAFKYTSTSSAATTWEIDNVKVKGSN